MSAPMWEERLDRDLQAYLAMKSKHPEPRFTKQELLRELGAKRDPGGRCWGHIYERLEWYRKEASQRMAVFLMSEEFIEMRDSAENVDNVLDGLYERLREDGIFAYYYDAVNELYAPFTIEQFSIVKRRRVVANTSELKRNCEINKAISMALPEHSIIESLPQGAINEAVRLLETPDEEVDE